MMQDDLKVAGTTVTQKSIKKKTAPQLPSICTVDSSGVKEGQTCFGKRFWNNMVQSDRTKIDLFSNNIGLF